MGRQVFQVSRRAQRTDLLTAKLLLALASTVILGSESRGTHDHILLSGGSGSLIIQAPRHEDMGSGGIAPPFLTSALLEGEWSASRPGRFIPGEIAPPGTHWMGGWDDLRAGLDVVESRKVIPLPELEPRLSSP
jgi:hypothetical protein